MAALAYPGMHVARVYSSGDADRIAVYALRNVSANDTIELSPDFQIVNRAVVLTVISDLEAGAVKVTATQMGIPAGPSFDVGYLMVWGSGA